jgi:hypothetical protein
MKQEQAALWVSRRRVLKYAMSNKSMQASAQSESLVKISILHCAPPDLNR